MAADPKLQAALNMAARIATNVLKKQVPVKKGDLQKSIKVSGVQTDNSVKLVSDYLPYGVYTDRGTGPYRTRAGRPWNPNPGKGQGGIRPRFWTTLDQANRTKINNILRKAMADFIKISLFRKRI